MEGQLKTYRIFMWLGHDLLSPDAKEVSVSGILLRKLNEITGVLTRYTGYFLIKANGKLLHIICIIYPLN